MMDTFLISQDAVCKGQGKSTALLSANVNVLSISAA